MKLTPYPSPKSASIGSTVHARGRGDADDRGPPRTCFPIFIHAGRLPLWRPSFVGIVVLLLTAVLPLTPVPLSNVAPAVVVALISLADIEEDGLLLCSVVFARSSS
jgi:hypothetical protein